jgi:hypothetical protein
VTFSDKTDSELAAIVKTGAEAVQFLASEFYVGKLRPQLEREMRAAKKNGDWHPGMATDMEAIAIINSYNSGLQTGLSGIEVTVNQLIKNGLEAEKEINRRKEKARKESK